MKIVKPILKRAKLEVKASVEELKSKVFEE